MANDAVPVPTSDVIHKYGLKNALEHSSISEKSNGASFLTQVSNNPFFTAVSMAKIKGTRLVQKC